MKRSHRVKTGALGATLASSALVLAGMLPAAAADTPVTFDIGAGTLGISAPASTTLPTVASGATGVSGLLGPVVVSDTRGLPTGTWTATASSTDFTDAAGTDIPTSAITYTAGTASTTGTVILGTPGTGDLGTPLTAQNATALTGANTATWNPDISVAIPLEATTGTYTATITHSVA